MSKSALPRCRALPFAVLAAVAVTAVTPALAAVDPGFPEISTCSDGDLNWFDANALPAADELGLGRSKWVPQGMAYYANRDWVLISYYDSSASPETSLIEISERSTFRRVKRLKLPASLGLGAHVGGLAIGKGQLYVTSNAPSGKDVHLFAMSDVERLADRDGPGETLPGMRSYNVNDAYSYASFFNGNLFVGSYGNSRLYRYDTDASGAPHAGAANLWDTPSYVQGLEVTSDYFLFSRSPSRHEASQIAVENRATGVRQYRLLRNMSEGIVWVTLPVAGPHPGTFRELYVVFESTSTYYGDATCRSHRVWRFPETVLPGF